MNATCHGASLISCRLRSWSASIWSMVRKLLAYIDLRMVFGRHRLIPSCDLGVEVLVDAVDQDRIRLGVACAKLAVMPHGRTDVLAGELGALDRRLLRRELLGFLPGPVDRCGRELDATHGRIQLPRIFLIEKVFDVVGHGSCYFNRLMLCIHPKTPAVVVIF